MSEARFWFAEQRGTLTALAIFIAMFAIYAANHPAGFTADVVQTSANKGVLLAFVAMVQALYVITTGAVYIGIALALRPTPGGSVQETLADALTGRVFDVIPASFVALAVVILAVWVPFSRSESGRAAYAAGSSEAAAYMSGAPIR